MNSGFIIYNGKLIEASKPLFTLENRSFRYGDGLFESIRVINGSPVHLEKHFSRMLSGAKILKLKLKEEFLINRLRMEIKDLLVKNNIREGGRIKLTLFRDSGGLYSPDDNHTSYCVEAKNLPDNFYKLNDDGLKVDVYTANKKPFGELSAVKSGNALLYVLAAIHAKEQELDDCLILNEQGNIAEATSSNIFLLKNNELITPPLSEGCVAGVMREIIIESFRSGYNISERKISVKDLPEAEEIFLTNAISGIKWVGDFREKKYKNEVSKQLVLKLNDAIY